ncbi:hypothetical protein SPRG_20759 [Saprolegnia parasitica CBS 223.65]|uniref:Uncharacterized protein n=1 Tax=Saprolegnia parasitica (strain CBS 223.65) TaxID=695850 RepID=A0A067C7Q7_SAPPC|nr:hypothetical protein SPRG_20759 [Saprolegnia parasitica CBS 223.65]KDO25165.1 hypothetical protein SPRG_20759 [Saprolegnia parasitica CBS 223.65]|eukprot:XP_012204096.1 hypothetical protein SPRG_20759 [Saprolegnia parasitica CBS 223.65]
MVYGSRAIRVAPRVSNLEERDASHPAPHLAHVPVVRRTRLVAFGFVLSCLWNLLSPFKTWAITTYGFLSYATTRTELLEWNTVLNGRFLTQLYASAGIPLASPLAAERYINVALDFLVLPRSHFVWAASPIIDEGPFLRSTLTAPPATLALPTTNYYVAPVLHNCRLAGVTEAVLCLRGENASADLNATYPYLSTCLTRRQTLLATGGSLIELASALATEFDLDGTHVAGSSLLFAPVTFMDGFLSLSGEPSGLATYRIYGRRPRSNSRLTVTRIASTRAPQRFSGMHEYHLDNADFTQVAAPHGFAYTSRKQAALADVEYVSRGNLSAWNGLFKQLVATVNNAPIVVSDALEELCLVGDGCFNVCMNETASGGTTLTYMRSGVCVSAVDKVAHGLLDVFVDLKCFGLGTGASSVKVTYLSADGVRRTAIANQTASPVAILACFVGGRAPQSDYPSHVMDMLSQGTQAAIVVTYSNGDEAMILNFIALLSLVGYGYYGVCICLYLRRLRSWLAETTAKNTEPQRRYSVANANISCIIWMHHRTSMKFVGFVSFLAWHIDAAKIRCAWAAAIDEMATDATYSCSVDSLGHLDGVVSLASFAWIFFALVYMDLLPGVTIQTRGYLVTTLLLGALPLSLLSFLIAELCKLRRTLPGFSMVHEYLFLALLWGAVMALLRTSVLLAPALRLLEAALRIVGVRRQAIDPESAWAGVIGHSYWVDTSGYRPSPVSYVPLSLLLETPHMDWVAYQCEYVVFLVLYLVPPVLRTAMSSSASAPEALAVP